MGIISAKAASRRHFANEQIDVVWTALGKPLTAIYSGLVTLQAVWQTISDASTLVVKGILPDSERRRGMWDLSSEERPKAKKPGPKNPGPKDPPKTPPDDGPGTGGGW
jgi:hypothetical protein